ncbi:MAG: hypothetical protein IMZ58_02495 [Thermoplasmata archaeon]|nr:hypothetical protein [Thermoplasmata archaeon]
MHINKTLRATTLALLIILASLLSCIQNNTVTAQPSGETTTLYFTKYDPLGFEEESINGTQMSLTPQTTTKDSELPPPIFIKNESKILRDFNTEELLAWIDLWIMFKFSDFSSEFGDTEGLPDEWQQYLDELFEMYNPFKIQEDYTYTGEQPVEISGDIIFNLFFASKSKFIGEKDNVKVSIGKKTLLFGELPITKEIKNLTTTIKPTFSNRIKRIPITLNLENESILVEPNDIISFSVEITPSQRTLSKIFELLNKIGIDGSCILNITANLLSKRKIDTLQQFGETLKEIINTTATLKEGINISLSDAFWEIVDALRGSSFYYGSSAHPSHIILPLKLTGENENSKVYYLHSKNIMDENKTTNDTLIRTDFSKKPITWAGPALSRSKILKDSTAIFYLNARDLLRKISVSATLYNGDEVLATTSQNISRDFLLSRPNEPVTFIFNDINKEINYNDRLSLTIAVTNDTSMGLFGKIRAWYDTEAYPSLLMVTFDETDNIKVTSESNPPEGLIVPGSSVLYTLNITSKKTDNISVTYTESHVGAWKIAVVEDMLISLAAGASTQVHIFVNSTNQTKDTYGNTIDVTFIVQGNTGITREAVSAEVSEAAIVYDVEILGYSNNINISKGENRTFYFVIKNNNTGAIDDVDSYTISASSNNDWPLIARESIRNLVIGDSTDTDDARVVIQVPKDTTLNSDIITITVTSDGDPSTTATINVTVHVIAGDFLESIYNLFDSAAETLGLNEMFGSYGAIVLASILMIIILFLLIILALVFTTKHVRIICTDRIKEIEAAEKAIFELTLQNPSKKTQSYEILAQQTAPSSKWMIAVEPLATVIDGRQSKTVQIIVTQTNNNESKDWTQVTVHVKKTGKKKTEYITLIAMIKEGKTLLKLDNVSHWPTVFNPGEKVTTSCNISNNGTVSARNVKVFFYLNGKQKNMVEVTIPAGSIADLQIPWIAVKGKNQVRIRLKE